MDPTVISALIGAAGSLGGAGLKFIGASEANAQNMLMNTGAWKAQQINDEARMLGVSKLALLGQNFQPTPAQNVFDDAGSLGTSLGQNLGRAISSSEESTAAKRFATLKEQNLMLQNANLQNDFVAGQLRNSANRLRLQPSTPPVRPDLEPYGPWWPVGIERPKAGMQAWIRPDGGLLFGPSASQQSGLWSPVPGFPANPQATSDVARMNALNMPPPDVVRQMGGLPPGAYPFVPGTADWRDSAFGALLGY